MRNQKGFSAIMLAMVVLFLVLSLMGSAGIYFQNLYAQIGRAKSRVAAQVVMVSVGRLLQTAHQNYNPETETCRIAGTLDKPHEVCWGSSANAKCVEFSLGGALHQVCLQSAGKPGASKMELVFHQEELQRDFKDQIKSYYYAFKDHFSQGLTFMVSQIQNRAEAQTASEMAHLPPLSGAPSARFSAGLNCSGVGDATYCKRCEGLPSNNLNKCIRVRICLRPGGCTKNEHWISRVFGFLK